MEERVSVSLPADVLERVRAVAARDDRSIASVVRLLIRDGLEARERRR
jgi:hypothetical protein